MNINPNPVSTTIRLQSIGSFAALMLWCVVPIEFDSPILLRLFDEPEALGDYLKTYGEHMSAPFAPGYQSILQIIDMALFLKPSPITLTVTACLLGTFFMRLSKR